MAGSMGEMTNSLLGLQALAQGREQMKQQQSAIEDRKIASDSLRRFYESQQSGNPDYSLMNEAVLRSPELAQTVLSHIGIQEKRQGQDAAGFISRAASVIDNPDQFLPLAQARVQYLQQTGRDPKDTLALIDMVQSGNSQAAKKDLQGVAAALTNQGYLDKDLYGQLFGGLAKITPYQQAQIDLEKERLGIQREGLNIDRAKLLAGNGEKPLDAKDIQGIQKDVSGLLQETNAVHRAAKSLEALKDRASPLSQTAAVFAFMKSLDPTSAVRETEQGQVYDAQGAASSIAAKLNKMLGEGGLTKEGFQDIVDTSKTLADSAVASSEQQLNEYLDAYGNTIPTALKSSLIKRIPKRSPLSLESKLTGQDLEAYNWAKANPNDPRAAAIRQKLGVN